MPVTVTGTGNISVKEIKQDHLFQLVYERITQ